jgi:hypothetical protein
VFARANILKEIKRHLAAGTGAGLQNAVLLWVRHRADFLPSLDLAGSFVNPEQTVQIVLHPYLTLALGYAQYRIINVPTSTVPVNI